MKHRNKREKKSIPYKETCSKENTKKRNLSDDAATIEAHQQMKWFKRNVKTFTKALTDYRPWDYTYMNNFIASLYRDQADYHETKGHTVNHLKTAKRARILARLWEEYEAFPVSIYHCKIIDRLLEKKFRGGFVPSALTLPEERLYDRMINRATLIQYDRRDMLFKYLKKYHTHIWD